MPAQRVSLVDDSSDQGFGDLLPVFVKAVQKLNVACVAKLFERKYTPAQSLAVDEDGQSLLHHCVQAFDGDFHAGIQIVDLLLRHGADVEMASRRGELPLVLAVKTAATKMPLPDEAGRADLLKDEPRLVAVQRLLEAKACPNVCDADNGQTPLLEAALQGDEPLCELLLSSRADPEQADHQNATVLDFVDLCGSSELRRLMGRPPMDPASAQLPVLPRSPFSSSSSEKASPELQPRQPTGLTEEPQVGFGAITAVVQQGDLPGLCHLLSRAIEADHLSGELASIESKRHLQAALVAAVRLPGEASLQMLQLLLVYRADPLPAAAGLPCPALDVARREVSTGGAESIRKARVLQAFTGDGAGSSCSGKEAPALVVEALTSSLNEVVLATDFELTRRLILNAPILGGRAAAERALCAQNRFGETPLHFAVGAAILAERRGGTHVGPGLHIIRLLLNAKAEADAADRPAGETPLMEAACAGSLQICQLLTDFRADPQQQKNAAGLSAADYASLGDHQELCSILSNALPTFQHAAPSRVDPPCTSSEAHAVSPVAAIGKEVRYEDPIESVEPCPHFSHMPNLAPDVDPEDSESKLKPEVAVASVLEDEPTQCTLPAFPTELLQAVCKAQPVQLRSLLKASPSPEDLCRMTDAVGRTLLHHSALAPSSDRSFAISTLLLRQRAEVDARSASGETSLCLAVRSSLLRCGLVGGPWLRPVQTLLEGRADANLAGTASGATPLMVAASGGSFAICRLLLEYRADANHTCLARAAEALESAEHAKVSDFLHVMAEMAHEVEPLRSPASRQSPARQQPPQAAAAVAATASSRSPASRQSPARQQPQQLPPQDIKHGSRPSVAGRPLKSEPPQATEARPTLPMKMAQPNKGHDAAWIPQSKRPKQWKPPEGRRVAEDNEDYCYDEFIAHYGATEGRHKWSRSPVFRAGSTGSVSSSAPFPKMQTLEVKLMELDETIRVSIAVGSKMRDLRLATLQQLSCVDHTQLTFADPSVGTPISDEEEIASLGPFEAFLDPVPTGAKQPTAKLEAGCSHAPMPTTMPEQPSQMRQPEAATPQGDMAEKQRECTDAGLDVSWCNDPSMMDNLLSKARSWERSSVKLLRQACTENSIPIEGLVERSEIVERLRQVLVWQSMPHNTQKEISKLIEEVYGAMPVTKPNAARGPALQPKAAMEKPVQKPRTPTGPTWPKAPQRSSSSRSTSSPIFRPKAAQKTSSGSFAKPQAAMPKTATPSAKPNPTGIGFKRMHQAQPPASSRQQSGGTRGHASSDEDPLYAHSKYKPSQLTPKIRKAFEKFSNYSGVMPPAEAEELWTDKEMDAFFFSDGFLKPTKKRRKDTKVLPDGVFHDHCRTLGIPANTKPDAMRKHYRKLALKYHPDKNPDPVDAGRFQQIGAAYEALCQHMEAKKKEAS